MLYIEYAGLHPLAFEHHFSAAHSRYAGCVAHTLCSGVIIGILVLTVVPYIIGLVLAILDAFDLAANGGLSLVVLAEF